MSTLSTSMLPWTSLSSLLGHGVLLHRPLLIEREVLVCACLATPAQVAGLLSLVTRELLTPSQHRPASRPCHQVQTSGTCAGGLRHACTNDPLSWPVRDHTLAQQTAETATALTTGPISWPVQDLGLARQPAKTATAQPGASTGCSKSCGSQPKSSSHATQRCHATLFVIRTTLCLPAACRPWPLPSAQCDEPRSNNKTSI